MKFLKKIWNYSPDPERANSVQSKALRGLCLFLAVMVCCTVISRAADKMTLALVRTGVPQRQVVSHTVKVDGSLEAVDRVPVIAESSTMVSQVFVTEGQQVEEGQLLFTLDVTQLRRQVTQKQLDLQRLNLQLTAQQESDALNSELKEQTLERSREDYDYTKDKAERNTAKALDEMNEARRALDFYDGDKYEDKDAYEAAVKALRADYRAKIRDYEQALADEAETLMRAERSIADADADEINIQADLLAVDIQLAGLEIAWLQEVLATNGEIYAPASGIVTSLLAETGKHTGADASAYIVSEGNLRFTAEISEEEQKYVERGSAVSLTLPGNRQAVTGLQVASLSPVAGSTNYKITVELPANTGNPDSSATAEITQKSQMYDTCVPLAALYQTNNQYYVLVLDESDTPLGLERTVRKIDVTLQESNETLAAVTGAISQGSRVIIATDRPLSTGDRVRLQEDL